MIISKIYAHFGWDSKYRKFWKLPNAPKVLRMKRIDQNTRYPSELIAKLSDHISDFPERQEIIRVQQFEKSICISL